MKVAKYVYTNLVPTRTNGIIYGLVSLSRISSGQCYMYTFYVKRLVVGK